MLRELALPDGGFASAHDADTDGVEGLTYTWTPEEADAVGLPRELLEPFEHGRYIVRGELEPELRERVLAERDTRPQPFRDDKALASWNGLALAALAEAGYRLERADWLDAARRLGEFLLGPLSADDGRLLRSIRDGRTSGFGFLDDYANVALRAARAPRRDRRAALAARGSAARAPRGRAVRRRRARRLLPLARGRRRARRAHEGPPGHADPVGELDARVRAPAPLADLGRRRARASRGLRLPPRRARAAARAGLLRLDALRDRPLAQPAARDRDRRRRRLAGRAGRAGAVPAGHGRRGRPVGGGAAPRREAARRRESRPSTSASASPVAPPSPNRRRWRSDEGLPDDRGSGGRHLGRLGAPRAADRGARARGALPLRSLHGDHPAGRRRARRVGDARGPRRDHESHPARHAGLAGDVPAPERARAHGGHGRPHLGRPRRGRDGLGLVRARARGARLPVPRRKGSASSSSPSRSRSSCAPGPRSASTTTGLRTGCATSRRFRGPSSSRIRRSSSAARSSRGSPRSPRGTRPR